MLSFLRGACAAFLFALPLSRKAPAHTPPSLSVSYSVILTLSELAKTLVASPTAAYPQAYIDPMIIIAIGPTVSTPNNGCNFQGIALVPMKSSIILHQAMSLA